MKYINCNHLFGDVLFSFESFRHDYETVAQLESCKEFRSIENNDNGNRQQDIDSSSLLEECNLNPIVDFKNPCELIIIVIAMHSIVIFVLHALT